MTRLMFVLSAFCACGETPQTIIPGERIDEIYLGMTWDEARAVLGPPSGEPVVLTGLVHARWSSRRLEVLLTSPDPMAISSDAVVIGVATTRPAELEAIHASFGEPDEASANREAFEEGFGLELDDGAVVRMAVYPPIGARTATIDAIRPPARFEVDGAPAEIVDMHLHPGNYRTMAPGGSAFIIDSLPPFLRVFGPDLVDRLSDPWAPHVGIAAQTANAAVAHTVLFAVYAPGSTGVFSNESLLEILRDRRNQAAQGPWAWGMASFDFSDWSEDVGAVRFAALRAMLATEPSLIGIKLAFAHQNVPLDDATTRGLYEIAREANVPILHHTGFSPFPGTQNDPRFYDPSYLEGMLEAYSDVDVVLSHVGQGDARALEHALDLAARFDHVWLELSALGRPLLVDAQGAPVMNGMPQYPVVLDAIRARGLIGKTLFASDGPQYPGFVRGYVERLVAGMRDAGYSRAEIAAVLSDNFYRLYRRARRV